MLATLYYLVNKSESTKPTIGYNVENVSIPPLELMVWDVSGQERLRTFWRHYYHGTSGIIFVVDSCDVDRFKLARKELHSLLLEEELSHAIVLILANKADMQGSVTTEELIQALQLDVLTQNNRLWHIEKTVATTGSGIREGLTWLAKYMKPVTETALANETEINTNNAATTPASSNTAATSTASSSSSSSSSSNSNKSS